MKQLPVFLFAIYIGFFILMGMHPYSRSVWIAENTPIVLIVLFLAVLYLKHFRFSNTSYLLMGVLIFMHTLGGHYTFERVPFDWFDNLFGFKRNMYDRAAHFSVGFYAYAFMEYLERRNLVNERWVAFFASLCFIISVAAVYEMIEWAYAVSSDPASGAAFLGSQGDIWDAQKDMLMDTLGAVTALVFYKIRNFKPLS